MSMHQFWGRVQRETVDCDMVKKIEDRYQHLQQEGSSESLLKKYLTTDVFNAIKARKTILGATLWDVMEMESKALDSNLIVLFPPDPDCYITFKELFDAVIADHYERNFTPSDQQPAVNFGENQIQELGDLDPKKEFISSTRIRVCRTIAGYPFAPMMSESNFKAIEANLKDAFEGIADDQLKGTYHSLAGMTDDVKSKLISDHFLFKEDGRLLRAVGGNHFWPTGRGIFYNADKTFLAWANEEDHLRLISMQKDGDVAPCGVD